MPGTLPPRCRRLTVVTYGAPTPAAAATDPKEMRDQLAPSCPLLRVGCAGRDRGRAVPRRLHLPSRPRRHALARTLRHGGAALPQLAPGPRRSQSPFARSMGAAVVAWNVLTGAAPDDEHELSLAARTEPFRLRGPPYRDQARTGASPDTLDVFRGAQQHCELGAARAPAHAPRRGRLRALHRRRTEVPTLLRLADGRIAGLGPAAAGDDPQISARGAVFAPRPGYTTSARARSSSSRSQGSRTRWT
jgi:hypothetical protein